MKFKEIANVFKECETEHFKIEALPTCRTIKIKYYNDELKDFPHYKEMNRIVRATVSYQNTITIILKYGHPNTEINFRREFSHNNSRIFVQRGHKAKELLLKGVKNLFAILEKRNSVFVKESMNALESNIYINTIRENTNKRVYEDHLRGDQNFRYSVGYDKFSLKFYLGRETAYSYIKIDELYMRSKNIGDLIKSSMKMADIMDEAMDKINQLAESLAEK